MKFHEIEARKPRETLLVPPFVWAETWDERPRDKVVVGLRSISEGDKLAAIGDARKAAYDFVKEPRTPADFTLWTDTYNDFVMRRIVARGVCDPNDVSGYSEPLGMAPEEFVIERLSTEGVRFFFDALERFNLAHDETRAEATNDEIESIADRLHILENLKPNAQARLRRLLRFVIDQLPAPD